MRPEPYPEARCGSAHRRRHVRHARGHATSGGRRPSPGRWRISFGDGQQRGAQGAPGHWVLAQALLDFVAPNPEGDETVRLWYIATSAWGQYYERHTRHEDRAAELFPEDAEVLFLAGTLHETLASPMIQSLVRSISVPGSALHQIGSERRELEKAEKLFRRALEADPALTEARIRRGRVLHRLGKHEQAARELQQAVSALSPGASTADDDDGLLLFYAEMFLGAATEALGRYDQARDSYARAAELYPGAPSARLALSQLALRGNDRAAALEAMRASATPAGVSAEPRRSLVALPLRPGPRRGLSVRPTLRVASGRALNHPWRVLRPRPDPGGRRLLPHRHHPSGQPFGGAPGLLRHLDTAGPPAPAADPPELGRRAVVGLSPGSEASAEAELTPGQGSRR